MLTTVDNPYDPFDQFDLWYQFDLAHGYNSTGLLARLAYTSTELSEVVYQAEQERAIDRVVALNPFGVHRKVVKEV
jgi:hypothetical protein